MWKRTIITGLCRKLDNWELQGGTRTRIVARSSHVNHNILMARKATPTSLWTRYLKCAKEVKWRADPIINERPFLAITRNVEQDFRIILEFLRYLPRFNHGSLN